MIISARCRLILEKITISSIPVPLESLARTLDVSERTIRRDLQEIHEAIRPFDVVLRFEKGELYIEGTEAKINTFKWHLFDLSHSEFTPNQRGNFILKELIKSSEPVTITHLAHILNVTESTVRADILKLEEELDDSVKIDKRRGMGITLNATESQKRTLIRDLLHHTIPATMLYQYLSNNHDNTYRDLVEDKLLGFIDLDAFQSIEDSLITWRNGLEYEITDDAFLTLLIHFIVAVERIKTGDMIESSSKEITDLLIGSQELVDAQKLLDKVMGDDAVYPMNEVFYISQHLRSVKLNESHQLIERDTMRATNLAQRLIHQVESKLNYTFDDESLLKGLATHLRSAVRRLEQGMQIQNPLIDSIKADHSQLFDVVKTSFNDLYLHDNENDDEVGYLVLHFGAAMIQSQKRQQLKGLIICSSGIGTSKMLLTRIQRAFPQFTKLKTASVFEALQRDDHEMYDVIISTIDLGKVGFSYLLVSPILSQRDIKSIDALVIQRHFSKSRVEVAKTVTISEAINYFSNVKQEIEVISKLIESFEVTHLKVNSTNLSDYVRAMCMISLQNTYEMVDVELILKSIIDNKYQNGFAIPGTHLAFFHERSAAVKESTLKVFPLSEPIQVMGLDDKLQWVSTFILLLAPEKLEKFELEILSFTSSLIIESERASFIFERGNEEEISSYLVSRYKQYIQEEK